VNPTEAMTHEGQAARVHVYHAEFDATLDEVSRVCAELQVLAQARGSIDWAAQIDLGLTEALSNVVRHGYGPARSGRMSLQCEEQGEQWLITLKDRGDPIPKDLLDQADGSVFDFDPDDVQSIPEGGMGLSLIRNCFDQLDYQAEPDGNTLALHTRIGLNAA
jgi:serine/threonine-protein kinase RsbW